VWRKSKLLELSIGSVRQLAGAWALERRLVSFHMTIATVG